MRKEKEEHQELKTKSPNIKITEEKVEIKKEEIGSITTLVGHPSHIHNKHFDQLGDYMLRRRDKSDHWLNYILGKQLIPSCGDIWTLDIEIITTLQKLIYIGVGSGSLINKENTRNYPEFLTF